MLVEIKLPPEYRENWEIVEWAVPGRGDYYLTPAQDIVVASSTCTPLFPRLIVRKKRAPVGHTIEVKLPDHFARDWVPVRYGIPAINDCYLPKHGKYVLCNLGTASITDSHLIVKRKETMETKTENTESSQESVLPEWAREKWEFVRRDYPKKGEYYLHMASKSFAMATCNTNSDPEIIVRRKKEETESPKSPPAAGWPVPSATGIEAVLAQPLNATIQFELPDAIWDKWEPVRFGYPKENENYVTARKLPCGQEYIIDVLSVTVHGIPDKCSGPVLIVRPRLCAKDWWPLWLNVLSINLTKDGGVYALKGPLLEMEYLNGLVDLSFIPKSLFDKPQQIMNPWKAKASK